MSQSFSKKEHLCGLKPISKLHTEGKAFIVYPFRVSYLEVEDENNSFPVRIMIGVPKKRFKKAVDRNRIKRQIREVYRKNKQPLVEKTIQENRFFHISFQYIANDILPHVEMNIKMIKTLGKLHSLFFEKTLNEYETDKTDN